MNLEHEVRLWLSEIAYKLGNLWRRLVLRIEDWSLTSLQQRLVKVGGLDQARELLLAASCGEPSDVPALCMHAAEDRGAAIASGLATRKAGRIGWRQGELSAESIGKTAFSGIK
jgi:hypothetical protein